MVPAGTQVCIWGQEESSSPQIKLRSATALPCKPKSAPQSGPQVTWKFYSMTILAISPHQYFYYFFFFFFCQHTDIMYLISFFMFSVCYSSFIKCFVAKGLQEYLPRFCGALRPVHLHICHDCMGIHSNHWAIPSNPMLQ